MQPLSSTPSHSVSPSHQETPPSSGNPKDKVERSTPPQPLESVSLSQTGQEFNHYTEAMTGIPDIRQERITEIQAALQNGTYSVSAQDLADKLIQEISVSPPDSSSSSI